MITHFGGCHCDRVRFEVQAPARLRVLQCNCSICRKSAFLHLVVPVDRFRLVSGTEVLTSYRFNTHTAEHLFCSICGIKSFYVPREDPFSCSVNVRCLHEGTVEAIDIVPFDGKHWGNTRRFTP